MQSELLQNMGFGNIDIGYILFALIGLFILIFILLIVQIVKSNKLKIRYEKFMKGKEAKSLEQKINMLIDDNEYWKGVAEENKRNIKSINREMTFSFQKMGIVKYDAFKEMGGKLSFSLALLNDNNDGFIMNSVHSSDGCYSYTKTIKGGEAQISLGEEEKKALEKALDSKKIPESRKPKA